MTSGTQYNPELVQFKSTDYLQLPGLLYRTSRRSDKIALYLHGNGSASVFYSVVKMNALACCLNDRDISFFTFNNRGAHYIHSLDRMKNEHKEEVKSGTAYELIRDCVKDIDGAIGFLRDYGYRTFYLMGSSTGANKIVVYHYYSRKNPIKKYILLSSGDDVGLYFKDMGKDKFQEILSLCHKKIKEGKGMDLVSEYLGGGLISYRSLYDTINPDGDYNIFPFNEYMNNLRLSKKPLFREYKTIDKPTLVIFGEKDEYCYEDAPRCLDIMKKKCPDRRIFSFELIKHSDHGFYGKEKELAKIIANWL